MSKKLGFRDASVSKNNFRQNKFDSPFNDLFLNFSFLDSKHFLKPGALVALAAFLDFPLDILP